MALRTVSSTNQLSSSVASRSDSTAYDKQAPADGIDAGDGGFVDVLRQLGANPVHCIPHLLDRERHVAPEIELDAGGGASLGDGGQHLVHVHQCGHRIFDLAGDVGFELRRRGAGQGHRDGDFRNLEIRQYRNGQLTPSIKSRDAQHGKYEHRRGGIVDAPAREIHCAITALPAGDPADSRTMSPSLRKPAPWRTTRSSAASPADDLGEIVLLAAGVDAAPLDQQAARRWRQPRARRRRLAAVSRRTRTESRRETRWTRAAAPAPRLLPG